MTRERLIFLVLAGGFAVMALEVKALHRPVLQFYWEGWIPIVVSGLASLTSFICLFAGKKLKPWLGIVFFLAICASGFGVYKHYQAHPSGITQILDFSGKKVPSEDGENTMVPTMAPASIAGLAMIGFILCVVTDKKKST